MTRSFPLLRGAAVALVACLVVAGAVAAQKPGGAAVDAGSARAAFRAATDKARDRLIAGLDRRIADAKKAGNLDTVELFTAQKRDFLASGVLPSAPGLQADVRDYRSDRRIAARLLVTTLKAAEEAATRADRLDEARQLRQERAEAEGAMASEHPIQRDEDPASRIQPGILWAGFSKVVGKHPGMEKKSVRDLGVHMRITDRSGDAFKGVYWVDGSEFRVQVEGWLGKSQQTRNGTWRDVSFQFVRVLGEQSKKAALGPASTHNGQIRGDVWRGAMPPIRQGQGVVTSSFEMNPSAEPAKKKRGAS